MSVIEIVQSVIEPLQEAKAQLLLQREEREKTFRQARKEHQKAMNVILDNVRSIDKMLAAAGVVRKPAAPKQASAETVEKVFLGIQQLESTPNAGPITRKAIATHVGVHSTSVSMAVKKLVEEGRIQQTGSYQGKQGPTQPTFGTR